MPLSKILFKPGVNRENTRYTTEGGWYDGDKIRFRQGNPEKIGGWQRISSNTFLGTCRSLWNWVTLGFLNLVGVGTNLKFYIERGGAYNDITPIRDTVTLTNPFTATNGSAVITVADTAHGCVTGDFVTYSGATGLGGNITAAVLNTEHQVTVVSVNSYTITVGVNANATDASGSPGGGTVTTAYQINVGAEFAVPVTGWGGGTWGSGPWGTGGASLTTIRLWSQRNYGEDLVFGPRGGGLYYWDATSGVTSRGVLLRALGGTATITIASPAVVTSTVLYTEGAAVVFSTTGALPTGITAGTTYFAFNNVGLTFQLIDTAGNIVNTSGSQSGIQSITPQDCPVVQNFIMVSDTSRFIFAMGTNDYGSTAIDPMLIRWSNQDDPFNWTPDAVNQAGSIRLSDGSEIITAIQTRQEIVVFTDSALYSLQYLGPPNVWQTQLLGANISLQGQNCVALASGIVYWMGVDKFYVYDGRVQTLNCDVRRYVFSDFNQAQAAQVFAGTNEGFNEVWWYYCSANSNVVDKYVVFNYAEKIWYYGTLGRTAWLDSGLRDYPLAATYSRNLVNHEQGLNNNETGTTLSIAANISSSEFDIGDGHNFGFVWRVLPDLTFETSSNSPAAQAPTATMTLFGLSNSGSGVTSSAGAPVAASASYVITEEFTGQIYTRMRGRQMIFKIESNQINTTWQIGAPRIDIRPDGRR
jgi:hypothetical protein